MLFRSIETEYNYRKGKKNTEKVEKITEKAEKNEEKVEKIKEKLKKFKYERPIIIEDNKVKCPECGAELSFTGGCNVCLSCGWSKCS